MNQINFPKMLKVLACWAKATKDYLEYQVNGKPPPWFVDARKISKPYRIRLSRSPGPFLEKMAMIYKPDQSTSDFLFEGSDDPQYRLSCMAQEVLESSESQWPLGGGGSEASRDLLALLRPIAEGGGRSATIADLKRIEELVESSLDGIPIEAKEPLGALVSDPQKAPVTATTGVSKRTEELARSVPDGKPVVVLPPAGELTAEGWCFGEKTIHVQDWLRPALRAYLDHQARYALEADNEKPYDMQASLKKLILSAQKYGFAPPQNSWPRGTKRRGCKPFVYFDSTEDGNRRNRGDHAKNR